MKANLGGQIAPSNVVGRDDLIAEIWEALEQQSVVLTAARRMGKTSVIKKMHAEEPTGFLTIYRDLEGLRAPLEFVETIYSDVESFLSTRKRVAKRTRDFIAQISGAEYKGVKLPALLAQHWKTLLTKIAEDLTENQDRTIVFFWDEMPMMLENIKQDMSEQTAMEVLDVLRALRQTYPSLRMVYTGSIGLHHVIGALKRSGYTNAPKNDMHTIDLPPLSSPDAERLALLLLEGEAITVADAPTLATEIARSVDYIPFYIHHIVARLKREKARLDAGCVEQVVTVCLTDPQDRWDMSHFRVRIDTYYLPDERPLALNLLDILAASDRPLTDRELLNLLASRIAITDKEQARTVLTLLQRDHYILLETDGTYRFYLTLIQRWWRINRGL